MSEHPEIRDEDIERVQAALKAAGLNEDYDVRCSFANAAILAMQPEWQPIETAPKDGTFVLLFSPDDRFNMAWIGQWRDDEEIPDGGAWWENNEGRFPVDADPTHWLPLPTPPCDAT